MPRIVIDADSEGNVKDVRTDIEPGNLLQSVLSASSRVSRRVLPSALRLLDEVGTAELEDALEKTSSRRESEWRP